MDYLQVRIYTTTLGAEPVGAAVMELGAGGFAVQDAADFEQFLEGKSGRWDYIDDELMKLRDAETTVTVYLPQNGRGAAQLRQLEDALARLGAMDAEREWGRLVFELDEVKEQDWAESWKKYYHMLKVGRLTICPSWEAHEARPGEAVLRMDPGMAFGTGTHETTRLCLELLQQRLAPGMRVLDVGCGSGILSVAALLLGAHSAVGADIDEAAVRTAAENAARNGVADRAQYHCGSFANGVEGAFDIVLANIVADAVITFLPDAPRVMAAGGALIVSGIIDTREQDVLEAARTRGYTVSARLEAGGWVALLLERAE